MCTILPPDCRRGEGEGHGVELLGGSEEPKGPEEVLEGEMGGRDEEDARILQFLDSMEAYVSLHHLLSSTLRQGWLELASARHSMGSSRISSALFDLKEHEASSVVQVTKIEGANPDENVEIRLQFSIVKWGSYEDKHRQSGDAEVKNESQCLFGHSNLRRRDKDSSGLKQTNTSRNVPLIVNDQVEKQRLKSLSVFGALVSPKLRSAQLSFETALETLVEIANMQSEMRSAFIRIRGTDDTQSKETAACEKSDS